METTQKPGGAQQGSEVSVAQLAKATLRRLATEQLEPTPDNYARAYAQVQGRAKPAALPDAALPLVLRLAERAFGGDTQARAMNFAKALAEGQWQQAQSVLSSSDDGAQQLANLIERLVRGVERGGRSWTLARKKDGLQRVLEGSRSDVQRLKQRLQQLLHSWESDAPAVAVEAAEATVTPAGASAPGAGNATKATPNELMTTGPTSQPPAATAATVAGSATAAAVNASDERLPDDLAAWLAWIDPAIAALVSALPEGDAESRRLRQALADSTKAVHLNGATAASAAQMAQIGKKAQRALQHRHHLVEQLGGLCSELAASMAELAESDSWARGQCEAMQNTLKEGITARGVKAAGELLRDTRARQVGLRQQREQARESLKSLIANMLTDLNELGSQTGRFQENVGRYSAVIESADSLEDLTHLVRDMATESRAVHGVVAKTQGRLNDEHAKAESLTQRVNELENELRRLADEVTTDQLTQVANRRGLLKVFEVERARMERSGNPLAVGLLDIDNFKRLNDEHGHQTGDEALKALAALVGKTLRATDLVARYGGEEFVVLLPETELQNACDILTRLQRKLSGGLFLNEQKNLLVTFSAGVTACGKGEAIEVVLERADQALYEAKRTGKNRTCIG
jgi:diguanylate cyclase